MVWRTAPGFLVLARPDGPLLTVTGPGADVWEAIDPPAELGAVVAALAARYAAPVDGVRRDVEQLLQSLAEQGFVDVG